MKRPTWANARDVYKRQLLALLAVSLPAGVVSIANILAVGLLMYVMNSTVQMLFQDIARADYPSALTFSASLHPMSFNAGIALGLSLIHISRPTPRRRCLPSGWPPAG